MNLVTKFTNFMIFVTPMRKLQILQILHFLVAALQKLQNLQSCRFCKFKNFSLPRSCNMNIPRSLKEQACNTSIYLVLYIIGQNKHTTHEYTLLFNPSAKTNMQHINIAAKLKIQHCVKSGPAFCSCYENRLRPSSNIELFMTRA